MQKVINVYHAVYNNIQPEPIFSVPVKHDFSPEVDDIPHEIHNYFRKHLFASFPYRADLTSVSKANFSKHEKPYSKKSYERNRELSFWSQFIAALCDEKHRNMHAQHQDLKSWMYHSYNSEYVISMFWSLTKEDMLEMKQRNLGHDVLSKVIEYVESRYSLLKSEV